MIAEHRARHDEHRHREAVRGNHPLHIRFICAELLLNVGNRDIHDHRVEEDHEQPQTRRYKRRCATPGSRPAGHWENATRFRLAMTNKGLVEN